jgi:hypothetical protein
MNRTRGRKCVNGLIGYRLALVSKPSDSAAGGLDRTRSFPQPSRCRVPPRRHLSTKKHPLGGRVDQSIFHRAQGGSAISVNLLLGGGRARARCRGGGTAMADLPTTTATGMRRMRAARVVVRVYAVQRKPVASGRGVSRLGGRSTGGSSWLHAFGATSLGASACRGQRWLLHRRPGGTLALAAAFSPGATDRVRAPAGHHSGAAPRQRGRPPSRQSRDSRRRSETGGEPGRSCHPVVAEALARVEARRRIKAIAGR